MKTSKFSRIGLVGRPDHSGVVTSLEKLASYLKGKELTIIADSGTADLLENQTLEVVPKADLGDSCDLVIVVGGDGSILNIAKHLLSTKVPVIGVNRGKLGFLTDILPDEIEPKLDEVLAGSCSMEERFLLDIYLLGNDDSKHLGSALNDVVLHPGSAAQMIEFELFIDDVFVYSQESDGLIIATPTGSTGYSLSCGGPIVMPESDNFIITPIAPHNLNVRPLIVSDDNIITLEIVDNSTHKFLLSMDSRNQYIKNSTPIIIKKAEHSIKLVEIESINYSKTLREKLLWGLDTRNNEV